MEVPFNSQSYSISKTSSNLNGANLGSHSSNPDANEDGVSMQPTKHVALSMNFACIDLIA